mmetsp:Transcript_5469/g.21570  ORF Transcript_5469/g.21570 Transcript_5469/m.21570 type:complete len:202 (+) Transcript_5469:345-950(+)
MEVHNDRRNHETVELAVGRVLRHHHHNEHQLDYESDVDSYHTNDLLVGSGGCGGGSASSGRLEYRIAARTTSVAHTAASAEASSTTSAVLLLPSTIQLHLLPRSRARVSFRCCCPHTRVCVAHPHVRHPRGCCFARVGSSHERPRHTVVERLGHHRQACRLHHLRRDHRHGEEDGDGHVSTRQLWGRHSCRASCRRWRPSW